MQSDLTTRLSIKPEVAAYAMFSTHFSSVESATDFIYEKQEFAGNDRPMMQHNFVGCLPQTHEFTQVGGENIPYLNDIENGKTDPTQQEICYICHSGRGEHREGGVESAQIVEFTSLSADKNNNTN